MGTVTEETLHSILGHFVGSHHWHNFTKRVQVETREEDLASLESHESLLSFPRNPELWRQVTHCGVVDSNEHMVRLEVCGHSFVYNQIRKVIGMGEFDWKPLLFVLFFI